MAAVVSRGLCSQRKACRYLGLHRSRGRYQSKAPSDWLRRLHDQVERGLPSHIRSDNGSEFITKLLQKWLAQRRVKTLYIEPGSPWQNGHVESSNGSLRDECLNRELVLSVAEARVLIEDYRQHDNQERPHGGIGCRTLAQARLEALDSSQPTAALRPELAPLIITY